MSVKRLSKSAVDWAKIRSDLPKNLLNEYKDIKGRSDDICSKISSLPNDKPKIDWNYYSRNIKATGLVEKFKKEYEAFAVPEPEDKSNWIKKIESDEALLKQALNKFVSGNYQMSEAIKEMQNCLSLLPAESEINDETQYAFYPWTHYTNNEWQGVLYQRSEREEYLRHKHYPIDELDWEDERLTRQYYEKLEAKEKERQLQADSKKA